MTKVYSIYTRVFHALFAISILSAYLSGDDEDEFLFAIHLASGALALALGVFRVIWGVIGPKYAKFSEFELKLTALKDYFLNIFSHTKCYVAHNPASSYSALFMIFFAIIAGISGIALLGVKNESGFLSFLYQYGFLEKPLKETHELISNLLILIIIAHILGVAFDHFYHKSGIARSMLNGYKKVDGESIKLNFLHHIFGVIWIVVSIIFAIYASRW